MSVVGRSKKEKYKRGKKEVNNRQTDIADIFYTYGPGSNHPNGFVGLNTFAAVPTKSPPSATKMVFSGKLESTTSNNFIGLIISTFLTEFFIILVFIIYLAFRALFTL